MKLTYTGHRETPFRLTVGTQNMIVEPGKSLTVDETTGRLLLERQPHLFAAAVKRKARAAPKDEPVETPAAKTEAEPVASEPDEVTEG